MKEAPGANSDRAKTGIAGLDDILGGGFPRDRLYLMIGSPGTGKTTLALEFLRTGVALGEKVLYITLSETREELDEVAASHGWKLDGIDILELSAIESQLRPEAQNTLFHPSEVELSQTTQMMLNEVERVGPSRVVFDSLSELRLLSQTPLRYRRQILSLKQSFTGRHCTTLMLDDGTAEAGDPQVQSLAHGVVLLEQIAPDYGCERRRLLIQKVRGTRYRGGYHDFSIETGGIVVFPRLTAREHRVDFVSDNVSSGVNGLDSILGGGLTRGTSTLFIGPAGSGKSTVALKFVIEAAARGERSAIYTLDETVSTVLTRARNLAMPLEQLIADGLVQLKQVDPANMSPGEFACELQRAVEVDDARVVYIDSLNGYLHAMGDQRPLHLQLHELVTYLNQQGVVTIMMLAPHGMLGQMRTPVDVTYLADTVIALRFYEANGAVHKAISVIKKRTGNHEGTIRELSINPGRIAVGRSLVEYQGIFSGTPSFQPDRTRPELREHEAR